MWTEVWVRRGVCRSGHFAMRAAATRWSRLFDSVRGGPSAILQQCAGGPVVRGWCSSLCSARDCGERAECMIVVAGAYAAEYPARGVVAAADDGRERRFRTVTRAAEN